MLKIQILKDISNHVIKEVHKHLKEHGIELEDLVKEEFLKHNRYFNGSVSLIAYLKQAETETASFYSYDGILIIM